MPSIIHSSLRSISLSFSSKYPYCFLFSRSLNASALPETIIPTVLQPFNFEQSPQVSHFLPSAHCLIGQRLLQKSVLTPSVRQTSQFIISGVISAPFISDQSSATFFRRAPSSLSVAILASHFSQSSPQYAISFFRNIDPRIIVILAVSVKSLACSVLSINAIGVRPPSTTFITSSTMRLFRVLFMLNSAIILLNERNLPSGMSGMRKIRGSRHGEMLEKLFWQLFFCFYLGR